MPALMGHLVSLLSNWIGYGIYLYLCCYMYAELPQVFSDESDSDDTKNKFPSKQLGLKSSQGSTTTATEINDGTGASVSY